MFYNWNQWVGQIVDGKFPLLKNIGCSDHSAVFLTERRKGDGVHPTAIKLIPAALESSEKQLSQWQLATGLSHPCLIQLFESGRCELGGVPLLYVVMEYADENLASVLPERALTAEETRAMLEAVLGAATYLHAKGFVHGHVKPANVMAHGEELKISSDGVCPAGEPGAGLTAPDDVWSIGATLVEALTQRPPVQQVREPAHSLVPLAMPEPFSDIARHCLLQDPASRWTVAQITDRLEGRDPAPQASTPVRVVEPPVVVPAVIVPAVVEPAPVEPPAVEPPAAQPQETTSESPKGHSYGVYIAAGFVLAAILTGPWLFLQRHPKTPSTPHVAVQGTRIQPEAKPQKSPEAHPAPLTRPADTPAEASDFTVASPFSSAGGSKAPTITDAKAEAGPPTGLSAPGKALQQILPDIPKTARDTIRGTVRVTVRVDVDHSGRVEDAELEAPGPSKYFAQLALEAAQRWQFRPPKVAGQDALSTWSLRFQFTSAETTVIPSQEIP